ncbi:MAG: hypothetical protein JSS82_11560 [Bacteroidetes bacterium]|nr:hypothetical protein [Bacteroidota bacterium]
MKNRIFLTLLLFVVHSYTICYGDGVDFVRTGIYITSIHNIDFKQKEYAISLWLWLRYHKKDFDFQQNLEIPQAKSVTKSFATMDSSGGDYYLLMKLDCVMKDSWKINNFPFDHQKLRFSIENSQFDSKSLVFIPDRSGQSYDARYTLRGWKIDTMRISTGIHAYETTFGDVNAKTPHSEYSTFKANLEIERDAMGLFWKMFLGMYISFMIAYMCFYIHADNIDSRFGLSVGALFAVVGNKYIIDSSLPESSSFTLVDALHGLTLAFILAIMICNAISLGIVKKDQHQKASKFDFITAQILLLSYIGLNLYFIMNALHTSAQ